MKILSLFYRNGKVNPQIHMESQETTNSQTILKKNQVGGTHTFQLQDLLWICNNQNNVVLVHG